MESLKQHTAAIANLAMEHGDCTETRKQAAFVVTSLK